MRERLIKAMNDKKRIKLLFDFPNAKSVKPRRGVVTKVGKDSFDFTEDKDGERTYRIKYLVEIGNA